LGENKKNLGGTTPVATGL